MTFSWVGALVTFQVTFTELFIASSTIAAALYRFGWRSGLAGSALGAAIVLVLAFALKTASYGIALRWLDWASACLLLGFGAYLFYECIIGIRERAKLVHVPPRLGWNLPVNFGGVSVAAWALIAEGIEILVVWLGVALREGTATATLGIVGGFTTVVAMALALKRIDIIGRVPPYALDAFAALFVTAYGVYFLRLAYTNN